MTQTDFLPGTTGFLVLCLAGYGLLVNILAFIAFAVDRSRARQDAAPVPRRAMLLLVTLGGWPGAKLAQITLRHRAGKRWFAVMMNLCGLILPVGLAAAVVASDPAPLMNFAQAMADRVAPAAGTPGPAEKILPRRFGPGSDDAKSDTKQD